MRVISRDCLKEVEDEREECYKCRGLLRDGRLAGLKRDLPDNTTKYFKDRSMLDLVELARYNVKEKSLDWMKVSSFIFLVSISCP